MIDKEKLHTDSKNLESCPDWQQNAGLSGMRSNFFTTKNCRRKSKSMQLIDQAEPWCNKRLQHLSALIQDCEALLKEPGSSQIKHITRERNQCADHLAKDALSMHDAHILFIYHKIPNTLDCIKTQLVDDSCDASYPITIS